MSKRTSQPKNWNYSAAVSELEAIIEQIESGSLPLEQVFEQFSVAVEKMQQCESFLARGKQQMNLLIETLSDEENF
ncbi:MAG: exodeoxyribonuclease VII small subunit [Oscillatoria sp. PMC 1051.18]|nr:exodeoxyribonuclease VII small subunit [Oscillatoria sp. PMC 1050.18]MEC5032053.1 exodeoxyribonuclease VII small subunit [Oscillatoria sp. PMC 1051.18]